MHFEELRTILLREKPFLQKRFAVARIGVFGSFVHGRETTESDVDILVEFSKPVGLDFIRLKDYLEKVLQKEVDLVTPLALKPQIKESILHEVCMV